MIYPTEQQIIDYFANLPTEVKEEFAPMLEEAHGNYRRVVQQAPENPQNRIDRLCAMADSIFKTQVSKRLRARSGMFEEFQRAIGLDGGDAELGFWYAHRLYNLAERGRMLVIWARQIQSHLWERIGEAENLWYTPDLVPEGWEPFLAKPESRPPGTAGPPRPEPEAEPTTEATAESKIKRIPPIASRPVTPSARWEALEISFLSDERVQIRINGAPQTRNYAEMGFADRRTGKPTLAWGTLRLLAEKRGTIRSGRETGTTWSSVEKRVQEIRRRLRELHGAPGDPLPFIEKNECGGKVSGYEAQFHISCAPAYES